jgi:hypothetical protein
MDVIKMNRRSFSRGFIYLPVGFVALCAIVYVLLINMGTTVINEATAPDGKWTAVTMVKNAGAASGYVTLLAVVGAHAPFRAQRAILSKGAFSVDDNDGAVHWGDKGQIALQIKWLSNQNLLIEYPHNARVIRQKETDGTVEISYVSK